MKFHCHALIQEIFDISSNSVCRESVADQLILKYDLLPDGMKVKSKVKIFFFVLVPWLKTLFNIVAERLKKLLNFDVSVVQKGQ